jgi:NhaP-type Na+/H+ or K+/H+ antiporter
LRTLAGGGRILVALITIAVILILYGVVSRPLDARGITSAMILTAVGLLVFALIALDDGIPHRQMLFTTVMLTIILSVYLHGLSSVPLVAAYSRWCRAHVTKDPSAAEAQPTIMSRLRHHPTREETEPGTAR